MTVGNMFFFGVWFLVLPVALIAGVIYLVCKIFRGSPGDREERMDEARMIQEIYQGLSRMERRVETLETLLLESDKDKGGQP